MRARRLSIGVAVTAILSLGQCGLYAPAVVQSADRFANHRMSSAMKNAPLNQERLLEQARRLIALDRCLGPMDSDVWTRRMQSLYGWALDQLDAADDPEQLRPTIDAVLAQLTEGDVGRQVIDMLDGRGRAAKTLAIPVNRRRQNRGKVDALNALLSSLVLIEHQPQMDIADFHRAGRLRQQLSLFDGETIDEALMATTDENAREILDDVRQQLPAYFKAPPRSS